MLIWNIVPVRRKTNTLIWHIWAILWLSAASGRMLPNKQGHIPTTMEWARRFTADDIKVLQGQAPYSEKIPNVDEGFTPADLKDPQRSAAIIKVIQARLAKTRQERPIGYLVREAPTEDVKNLRHLAGHLREGQFITKFRKIFARDEMNDDLLVAAREGQHEDFLSTRRSCNLAYVIGQPLGDNHIQELQDSANRPSPRDGNRPAKHVVHLGIRMMTKTMQDRGNQIAWLHATVHGHGAAVVLLQGDDCGHRKLFGKVEDILDRSAAK